MSGASKYYIVKVFTVESNIVIKLKNHTFPDISLHKHGDN